MKREIIWTAAAEADAQAWYNWFERRSDAAAERWANELIAAVERLEAFPEMAPLWRAPFRRLLLRGGSLGLFYVIHPHRLVVTGIMDLRRDPKRLIEEMSRRLP